MLYFTADLHAGHTNILRYCKRPFASVEEMDATMIANINAKVGIKDTLYVLGDLAFRGASPKFYLDQIHCKDVRLIIGNHDAGDHDLDYYRARNNCGFYRVENYVQIRPKIDGRKQLIILFHYPIQEWNGWHRGSWHLSGHTHSQNAWSHNNPHQYILDVGVDCHNFMPLSLYDITALMAKKEWHDPFKKWEGEGRLWKENRVPEEEAEQIDPARHKALDELADESQRLGFY